MPHFIVPVEAPSRRNSIPPPPSTVSTVSEPHYHGQLPTDTLTYRASSPDTAIVIDNASSEVRAGWQSGGVPQLRFPPLMARYTDRKLNRKLTFIGSEIFFDGTARGQAKNVYEPGSNIVNNWDVQEGILDYVFAKLGVDGRNGVVDRPVVMTEPLANLGYTRKVMSEILYELYNVPSVAYGVDSLFSYRYNEGSTGLVVSCANMSTHLIPVVDKVPLISHATRLDWGRAQCAEYLQRLLKAKYPGLLTSGKVTDTQIEDLVKDHCYVSQDYARETTKMLEWSGLEDRDRIVQLPFQEKEVVQKTEEEIRRAEEKRREGGRRLAEQAAKMRLEKLKRKEQELEYFKQLQEQIQESTKKDARALLEEEEFRDEAALDKRIKEMEKSIRKQRNKDVGDLEEEPEEPPTYPLLDVPDEELDEEGLKQKRQQRLNKSNHEARARAKAEKEAEKLRLAEIQRLDDERRENDLEGWIEERHAARNAILQRIRDRDRLKTELGNRKSQASQMRMKHIANLASDNPTGRKRRRGRDDDEGFGDDDADWAIYREIQQGRGQDDDEDEEEEDLGATLKGIEQQLLTYDPEFTEQSTQEAQKDWTKSLVHAFLRGPWPFDPESARESNQFHLNVERVRVPEVIFQPSIAGVDQAGIVEIAEDIVMQRLSSHVAQADILKDVFITGGYSLFQGFEERLRSELRAVLPAEMQMNLRKAKDPVLDAWKGAASWARTPESRAAFVSKGEWEEKGGEYLREHGLGNVFT